MQNSHCWLPTQFDLTLDFWIPPTPSPSIRIEGCRLEADKEVEIRKISDNFYRPYLRSHWHMPCPLVPIRHIVPLPRQEHRLPEYPLNEEVFYTPRFALLKPFYYNFLSLKNRKHTNYIYITLTSLRSSFSISALSPVSIATSNDFSVSLRLSVLLSNSSAFISGGFPSKTCKWRKGEKWEWNKG